MADAYPPPFIRPPRHRSKWPWLVLVLVAGLPALNHFYQWYPWPWQEPPPQVRPKVTSRVPLPPKVIDYGKVQDKSDLRLGEMILKRKKEFGLDKSVDMVVKSEESIRIGQETVPLSDILAAIKTQDKDRPELGSRPQVGGRIVEEDLSQTSRPVPPVRPPAVRSSINYYGVHVVRPGDNLWDIHFAFLREYFSHRGIKISPLADESRTGPSTGVARILKYAETMVNIFNMKTKRLDQDLNLLEPYEKVVVFNLTRLDRFLGTLAVDQLPKVRFDGRDLYIPEPNGNSGGQPPMTGG
ncbi:MAG: hypothetical protein SV487_08540 [Thermodesulfobacteriota bacterium]|nr:hypothetical protein [Thermodesulfobacteriota bacterium]